jgi:NAD(P)-dependent dehydrogenase (short-subunit alcohol dehydrogenase family)
MATSRKVGRQKRSSPAGSVLLGALGVGVGVALLRYAMRTEYSFRGRVVLITGGARGLGLVMARKLAGEGAKLVLCSRDSDELGRAKRELQQAGAEVMTYRCDVTDQDKIESVVRQTIDVWQRIDVLINNAGIIEVGPYETMLLDDYRRAMDTHFWGPLYAIHAVLPHMRAHGGGRIVNIASIGGRISLPHLLPYSASKFALVGLSEGLHAELAKDSIHVTTVTPGLLRTGSPRNAMFKGRHRAEYAWFAIADSLPGFSISAEAAAEQIVEACRQARPEITVSLPAKTVSTLHGLFPGLTATLLGMVNRLLPSPGGIGTHRMRGYQSESSLAPSLLTTLTEQAAAKNNQL